MHWVFLAIAIVAEVCATLALRQTEGFTRWLPSVIVVVGYGVSFYFVSLTLKTISVGVAYAIWSGVGIVLISLFSWLAFHQKLDWPALLGMALIITGVAVVNLSSRVVVVE